MVKRISGFAGLPLLSALASFILLPYIARVGGQGTWNALAIGQSAGGLAAILVTLGWTLAGPAAVAGSADPSVRRRLYAVSLETRSVVFVFCALVLAAGTFWLAPPGHAWEAFTMALAQAAAGLSPAWYCIATGHASHIARYDVVPRVLATLTSLPLLLWTGLIVLYPLALLLSGLAGTYFFTRAHSRRSDYSGFNIRPILRELWKLKSAAATTMAAGAYASSPVLIVAAVATGPGTAAFVSADKLYRVGLMATAALGNSLQGWVAEVGSDHARRRRFSLIALTSLGVVGWAGFSFLGPLATRLLFGEAIAANFATCFWFGASFLLVCITTSTGAHWLVPLGRMKIVFWSTIAGAAVGLPAILFLSITMQGTGGAMGLTIGELVVTAIQVIALLPSRRRRKLQEATL
jgi:O-antigen/teichoic acid export membrane protein